MMVSSRIHMGMYVSFMNMHHSCIKSNLCIESHVHKWCIFMNMHHPCMIHEYVAYSEGLCVCWCDLLHRHHDDGIPRYTHGNVWMIHEYVAYSWGRPCVDVIYYIDITMMVSQGIHMEMCPWFMNMWHTVEGSACVDVIYRVAKTHRIP